MPASSPRIPTADGLDNLGEFLSGTNPLAVDTDEDGIVDGDETGIHGTNPAAADSDGDGMTDGWELRYGLDPLNPADAGIDTDGDGFSNLDEFEGGTDPTNAQATPAARPWSNRNGDARQAAHAPIETDAAAFRLLWQLALDPYQHAETVITDGVVGLYGFSSDGPVVSGIDTLTGYVSWSRELTQAAELRWLRALDNSIGVIGESSQSIAASLWILDSETGQPIRTVPVGENRPQISAVTTDGTSLFGRVQDDLVHIDTETAQVVWSTPLSTQSQQSIDYPVAANQDYVVAAGSNSIFVFDRTTGSLLFDRTTSQCQSVNENAIMIDGDNRAFVVGSECAWAVDLTDGQVLWENEQDYRVDYPSVDDDALYVFESSQLRALDKSTGAIAWTWLEDLAAGESIVTTSTHVLVESSRGVTAINKSTRQAEWSHPIFGRMSISDEGVLIVESGEHDGLTAFNVSRDSDGDGLPDNWEQRFKLNHLDASDAALDFDHDGLSNAEEFAGNSDPTLRDTDGDGLTDFDELNVFGTAVNNADSDADGLADGDEVGVYQSNPLFADTDRDGFLDGAEANEYDSDPTESTSLPDIIFEMVESFENGLPSGWADFPLSQGSWLVDSGDASEGSFSLSTSTLPNGLRAMIEWTGEFADGDLYFDARVAQDSASPAIDVYVDDTFVFKINSPDWQRRGLRLSKGQHTIRFEYRYSFSGSGVAYIDNIEFTTHPPLASDTNNLLALEDEQLWEMDLQGELTRLPIRIPGAGWPFDIDIDHRHRVVIADRPYLHFYDPLTRRFTRKFVGQWNSGAMTPYDRGFIISNSSGFDGGLLILDLDGNIVDTRDIGALYSDLEVGPTGSLYALRSDLPFVEIIDIDTWSVVDSISIPEFGRGIAVDRNGFPLRQIISRPGIQVRQQWRAGNNHRCERKQSG